MIIVSIAVIAALAFAVWHFGYKIYHRRWLEAFIDSAGVVPWAVLPVIGFWIVAALAKIWAPESEAGRKWFNGGLIVGVVVLLLGWFMRAILWVAPDAIWPENENTGKSPAPAIPPKP